MSVSNNFFPDAYPIHLVNAEREKERVLESASKLKKVILYLPFINRGDHFNPGHMTCITDDLPGIFIKCELVYV